jgi:hypothetical protein
MCFRAICYWRDLIALAGVYTFSFLAVMGLFIGNLLLKFKRKITKTRESKRNSSGYSGCISDCRLCR